VETTYGLNTKNRALCWFTQIMCVAGSVGTLGFGAYMVYRLASGMNARKEAAAVLGVLFSLVFAVYFVVLFCGSRRMMRHSVTVSDAAIRVGDSTLEWDEIESIEHPRRTIGLAFCINTRDGRRVQVYPVQNARQLEDLIRDRLSLRDGEAGEAGERSVEESAYMLGRTWCVFLVIAQIALAAASAGAFLGLLTNLMHPSTAGDGFTKFAERVPVPALLLVLCIAAPLLERVKRFSVFGVTVFDRTVRIGGVTAKWDEIESVEHPSGAIGVAFRVVTRDGRKLSVPSGLERVRDPENLIRGKLTGSRS